MQAITFRSFPSYFDNHHQHLIDMHCCDHWCMRMWDFLMPEQKQHHVGVCENFHQQAWEDPNFMLRVIHWWQELCLQLWPWDQTTVFAMKETTFFKIKEGVSGAKQTRSMLRISVTFWGIWGRTFVPNNLNCGAVATGLCNMTTSLLRTHWQHVTFSPV